MTLERHRDSNPPSSLSKSNKAQFSPITALHIFRHFTYRFRGKRGKDENMKIINPDRICKGEAYEKFLYPEFDSLSSCIDAFGAIHHQLNVG